MNTKAGNDLIERMMDFTFLPFECLSKTRFKLIRFFLLIIALPWFAITATPCLFVMLFVMSAEFINNPDDK